MQVVHSVQQNQQRPASCSNLRFLAKHRHELFADRFRKCIVFSHSDYRCTEVQAFHDTEETSRNAICHLMQLNCFVFTVCKQCLEVGLLRLVIVRQYEEVRRDYLKAPKPLGLHAHHLVRLISSHHLLGKSVKQLWRDRGAKVDNEVIIQTLAGIGRDLLEVLCGRFNKIDHW